MQTFLTHKSMIRNAKNLDNKRLGKQRVEALQICDAILGFNKSWRNHPAVLMWQKNLNFLVRTYIPVIVQEWEDRGFVNNKVVDWWRRISKRVNWDFVYLTKYLGYDRSEWIELYGTLDPPVWLTDEFIESHRSNLIRKKPEHYKPLFPNTKEDLPYVWPIRKEK